MNSVNYQVILVNNFQCSLFFLFFYWESIYSTILLFPMSKSEACMSVILNRKPFGCQNMYHYRSTSISCIEKCFHLFVSDQFNQNKGQAKQICSLAVDGWEKDLGLRVWIKMPFWVYKVWLNSIIAFPVLHGWLSNQPWSNIFFHRLRNPLAWATCP